MKNQVLATLSSAAILVSGAAYAGGHAQDYALELTQLYAVTQTGSTDPAGDGMCNEEFGEHKGQTLSGNYAIDTSTGMMSATGVFLETEVMLYPLGIMGRYAFMSDGVPPALEEKKVNRIILNVSLEMVAEEGDVMFVTGGEYNCILSNLGSNNM